MRRHARRHAAARTRPPARTGFADADVSLLDVLDHVLNQGIVLSGEITLGVADVDLIHLRLLALVCSADRAPSSGVTPGLIAPLPAERRRW
jgi:hypothetical protein